MKTRKHGNGMTHSQVVRFSNRLSFHAVMEVSPSSSDFSDGFERGWKAACRYFAHELRVQLRDVESRNY